MIFGEVAVAEAEGAILAHSLRLPEGRLKKGTTLTDAHQLALEAAGIARVTVARLEAGDLHEDAAAAALAEALVGGGAGLRLTTASTGRVNIYAEGPGVLSLDVAALERFNRVHPMITVATLPDLSATRARLLLATVKIISYGVPRDAVAEAASTAPRALSHLPVKTRDATLLMTDVGAGVGKGEDAMRLRLEALGISLAAVHAVAHDMAALSTALKGATTDMILILTASATSDPEDVAPAALRAAGGRVIRFGMPVDPGNLLFTGTLNGRDVIGLPGCARSPALNGADWVLERTAVGRPPTDDEIAAMGVGGLLKESPTRPHPRERH